jgi:type IV pilus assembly protein PilW
MDSSARLPNTMPTPLYGGGFSLVELMVAMVIGLVLLLTLVSMVTNSSRTQRELAQASQQLENGRYAMHLLVNEIQHAGYFGEFFRPAAPPPTLPDPCSTDPAVLLQGITLHIQGYNEPATSPLSCIPAADHVPRTDILVLRRASTRATPAGTLEAGVFYVQGGPRRMVLSVPDPSDPPFVLVDRQAPPQLLPIRRLRTDIYFISPCREAAGCSGGANIPSLKRVSLQGASMVTETLVTGIENMQFDYGVDRNGDGIPNTDGTAPAYMAWPFSTDLWRNVMAVRVHVLARNQQPTLGHVDEKSYRLGLSTMGTLEVGPFEDAFKRHVFSGVARAVNPSGRREDP